ncbi:acetate/propionate family kinase [Mycoplasma sp. P36-A1]|uniref:acetate/propionate family kinase n=1 Tax=Mycoplasma sp. P36-A1 TaxID=3252900 RepID=UPI003C2AE07F
MSKIMAVNAGSSSLKYQLLEMPEATELCSGIIERIGINDSIFTIEVAGEKHKNILDIENHTKAVELVLEALTKYNVVSSLSEIEAVGHRMVHGGEEFAVSTIITDEVESTIERLSDLAPLHNPANLVGYRAFKAALPGVGHVAVFDTAFHQTMTKESYMYAIPYEYYTDYGVRRYGFHGTSHLYVSKRAIELLGNPEKSKIITCHLGNGASLAAVKDGKSINTSMGLTPLAGVMMGTRSGDIDPAIITFLMGHTGKTALEITDILNKKSGMLGISGISSDARDIEDGYNANEPRAVLTVELYIHRIMEVIGSYVMQLGGVDAIVFTAGLGENGIMFREKVIEAISEATGIKLDAERNNVRGKETLISSDDSAAKVFLIPTNEELVIAQDTQRLLNL